MADNNEYSPFQFPMTVPGQPSGLNLRKDVALLGPGEWETASNVQVSKEGTVESRSGRKRLGVMGGTATNPNKIVKLPWSGVDSSNPRYILEGTSLWRTTNYSSFTEVAENVAASSTESLEKRFCGATFHAGAYSGDPYIYLATPQKMLKDYGKSLYSSPLRLWGIRPPTAAASCAVGTPFTKDITVTPVTYTGVATGYEYVPLTSTDLDLAAFNTPSTKDSGFQRDGYDSEDYIELRLALENIQAVGEIRLWIDVDDATYVNYYEKAIAPNVLTPAIVLSQTVNEAVTTQDEVSGEVIELQPAFTSLDEVIRIKKKDFVKINKAGTPNQDTLNWKSIKDIKLLVQTITPGSDVTVHYMKLVGGFGPNSEISPGAQPYDYLYCFRNTTTGIESNPSPAMVEKNFVRSERQPITVTFYGVTDSNISGANSVAIYRRGGVFPDTLYRFVGYGTNPGEGADPSSGTFSDSASDADIAGNRTVEYDNDPPITSILPSPFRGALTGGVSAGWQTVTLSGSATTTITIGTTMQVHRAGDDSFDETVVVQSIPGAAQIKAFFQFAHAAGDEMTANAAIGKACRGAFRAFEKVFVYGDENNPHLLYGSKKARPESFPAIGDDGREYIVTVGSPGNPIMAAGEIGGEILSLNLESLYVIRDWYGQLQPPLEVVGARGLYSYHGWCKGDSAIYYQAYDGVYAWAGGQSIKISEQIDWMFKNRTINGKLPVDLGQSDATKRHQIFYTFHKNQLLINCWDTGGNLILLRYDTIYDRWLPAQYDSAAANAMLSETDTARLIGLRYGGSGGVLSEYDLDGTTGTSDDWTSADGENGAAIAFSFKTGALAPIGNSVMKMFGDVMIELTNPGTAVTVKCYYDHSSTADGADTFPIPAAAGRRLIPLPLQQSGGSTFGKQARVLALEFSGSGKKRVEIHSVTINAFPLTQVQFGRIMDWDSVGYQWDKRLITVVLDYDTNAQSVDLVLDTVSGISGNTISAAVQTFTISGSGRAQVSLSATDGIIAKKFRLRPTVETGYFYIFSHEFVVEQYPPDSIPATPYNDYGHKDDKRLQVLHLKVDTAGQNVSVAIEGDGATLQTIVVNSTDATRAKQFPLNDSLIAKNIRLKPTVTLGKFQLHWHDFDFEPYPADVIYRTEVSDHGYQYTKILQQLVIDVNTNGQAVPVIIEGDGVDLQTVTITTTLATRRQNLTLNTGLTAKKIRLKITPGTIPSGGRFQYFSHDFVWLPADKGPVFHTFDWDNGEYNFDKHLRSVTFFYENASGTTVIMDTITGIEGGTQNLSVQTFLLTGTGRTFQTFPLPNSIIAKAYRFRPSVVPSTGFKHWGYAVDKENYPQDIVYFTEVTDCGYEWGKHFQQINLDVDTSGQAVPVIVEIDGVDKQTVNVTSTSTTRRQTLTLNTGITGKKARIKVTPGTVPSGGRFQLFSSEFVWLPADKGPVKHSFDYTDLGWQHSKRLTGVVLSYDKGATAVTMQMDIIAANGITESAGVQTFVLTGTGRAQQQFSIDDGILAKAVRIRPQNSTLETMFKHWDPVFDFDKLPPDVLEFTPWDDLGWHCLKVLRSLTVWINTGGVACTVNVQGDGATLQSFSVTTTDADRARVLTLNSDLKARMVRLTFVPGSGGLAQYYRSDWDVVREPCDVLRWDSLELSLGYNGWKVLKQIWLQYICASSLTFSIYRDDAVLFYQKVLSAQSTREVQRFYLPDAVGTALNKSKRYRFVLTASTGFQFWAETSRVEWLPLGYDIRSAWAQLTFHQMLQPVAFQAVATEA